MRSSEYKDYEPEPSFGEYVMSAKEYAELGGHERPYRYEIEAGDKKLVYLGFGHSNDPENPDFELLKSDIEKVSPDLILVEGFESVNNMTEDKLHEFLDKESETDCIQKYGENVYVTKLALERGIKINSPEPDGEAMTAYALENGATRETVFMDAVSTALTQYNRLQIKPDLEKYADHFISKMKVWGWQDFDFSFENFKSLYKQHVGKDFDIADADIIQAMCDPIPWEPTPVDDIKKAGELRNRYRDKFIVDTIQQKLADFKTIYVVYGASHAVMEQPALEKLMEYERSK